MRDLMGMLGKAKEMQAKFQEMQEEIARTEVDGQSGGGAVKVTMTGKFDLVKLTIDPSLMKPEETEILEDLVMAACADARAKAEAEVQRRTQDLTSGLPLPAGFKLPF